MLQGLKRGAVDRPGMPEVEAHPFRRGMLFPLRTNAAGRELLLGIPVEQVVVTLAAIVQIAARCGEKFDRLCHLWVFRAVLPRRRRPSLLRCEGCDDYQPARDVEV